MTGLVGEKVSLCLRDGRVPATFVWRGQPYRIVEILAWWREPGDWWQGEQVRLFLRVRAVKRREHILELCKAGDQWVLHKVLA